MKKQTKNKAKIEIEDDPLASDLTGYLGTLKWRTTRFVLAPNDATVTIRVPKALVTVAKKVAKQRGIKYHRMMRDAIVSDVLKAA
jgi:predicted DNA binding CopG/RHH family protein